MSHFDFLMSKQVKAMNTNAKRRTSLNLSKGETLTDLSKSLQGRDFFEDGKPGYITAAASSYKVIKKARDVLKKKPTQAEKALWEHLRAKKTGHKIRRQHIIGHFVADFVCLTKKAIIEVDGEIHAKQKERDEQRTLHLNQLGYEVIRFSNQEVMSDPESVTKRIKGYLDAKNKILPLSFGEAGRGPHPTQPKKDLGGSGIFANLTRDTFDHQDPSGYMSRFRKGLSEELIHAIADDKGEPDWMRQHRLKAYQYFQNIPLPKWGPNLDALKFEEICYFAKAADKKGGYDSWDKVPAYIKNTFDRLGIPKAEKSVLAGVGAQYESEVVYHSLEKELEDLGVLFLDMDVALRQHPELAKKYFMKCVPSNDHKFAALHGAVWSGGTFLYVPKGVKIEKPLQAYFRMNAQGMGQFEHTLIVIDEGAEAHYIEGCSAPKYGANALHAGCVEVFVGAGAKFRYSSVENWSKDTYNLNTKRAIVEKDGVMEWVGGNMGSGVTMLYPASILKGENASANHLGIAFANADQIQDTGAKVFHIGKNTRSRVVMKSLSKGGGASIYRGSLRIAKTAENALAQVQCDALILDEHSKSDTVPNIQSANPTATIDHEAKVGRLSQEEVFYLMSRGLAQEQAEAMIVNGFISPIVRQLPLEYAVEMNRLIEMEMEGSIG